MENKQDCKFKVGAWVRIKGQNVKMKVTSANPQNGKSIESTFTKGKGCVYMCIITSSSRTRPYAEEDLEYWDDEPTTDPFLHVPKI